MFEIQIASAQKPKADTPNYFDCLKFSFKAL